MNYSLWSLRNQQKNPKPFDDIQTRSPKGRRFKSFSLAVSREALKKIGSGVRRLRIQRRVDLSTEEIAEMLNPKLKLDILLWEI